MSELKNLECLLPDTRNLLQKIVNECSFLDKYVLVGGSALALHLCHRQSEDLDFFTYDEGFDMGEILGFLHKFDNVEIISQSDRQIDVLIDGVKVTFFDARWSFLKPFEITRFNLASIESIAAMKVNTLFLRAKYRDYYDLYYISKEQMSLRDIFEKSRWVIEGITFKLFSASLLYIDDIEDDTIAHLYPKEQITKEQIRDFFQTKLDRMIR